MAEPTKIEFRISDAWQELSVNGEPVVANHRIGPRDWVKLLRTLGCTVDTPVGDFCRACGQWMPFAETNGPCSDCARFVG